MRTKFQHSQADAKNLVPWFSTNPDLSESSFELTGPRGAILWNAVKCFAHIQENKGWKFFVANAFKNCIGCVD